MTNSPEMRALLERANDCAKVLDVHARNKRLPPGDNDYHSSAEVIRDLINALSAPHAQGDVTSAVFFVICATPDGDQYGVFSTKDRAVSWADAQINPCIIVDHMVIDHPEFGNVANN